MLVARPPPGKSLSVNGGQLSATRRNFSAATAGVTSTINSKPSAQSNGRMLESFRRWVIHSDGGDPHYYRMGRLHKALSDGSRQMISNSLYFGRMRLKPFLGNV